MNNIIFTINNNRRFVFIKYSTICSKHIIFCYHTLRIIQNTISNKGIPKANTIISKSNKSNIINILTKVIRTKHFNNLITEIKFIHNSKTFTLSINSFTSLKNILIEISSTINQIRANNTKQFKQRITSFLSNNLS